ncbi:hypothetical protein [Clostridium sp.]|uniref:hypothetical protein n=1 Tax=Clostridium sp. TaxID=1506 RepID=UPI003D6D7E53
MIKSLELPVSYIGVDEEEMEYIDGGYYLNPTAVDGLLMSVGVVGVSAASIPIITAGIYSIAATMATIPGLGFVTGALLAANAVQFAWACVNASLKNKGVAITLGLPTGLDFAVC